MLLQSEVQLPPSPSPSPSNPPLPPTLRDIKLNAHPSQSPAWYGLPPLPLSVSVLVALIIECQLRKMPKSNYVIVG